MSHTNRIIGRPIFPLTSKGGLSLAAFLPASLFSRALTPEQIGLLAEGVSAIDIVTPPKVVVTEITVNPLNGRTSMTWSSRPGKQYSIYTSTNLLGDPQTEWVELSDSWISGGETTTFTDTFSGGGPVRFYVVIEN